MLMRVDCITNVVFLTGNFCILRVTEYQCSSECRGVCVHSLLTESGWPRFRSCRGRCSCTSPSRPTVFSIGCIDDVLNTVICSAPRQPLVKWVKFLGRSRQLFPDIMLWAYSSQTGPWDRLTPGCKKL